MKILIAIVMISGILLYFTPRLMLMYFHRRFNCIMKCYIKEVDRGMTSNEAIENYLNRSGELLANMTWYENIHFAFLGKRYLNTAQRIRTLGEEIEEQRRQMREIILELPE